MDGVLVKADFAKGNISVLRNEDIKVDIMFHEGFCVILGETV